MDVVAVLGFERDRLGVGTGRRRFDCQGSDCIAFHGDVGAARPPGVSGAVLALSDIDGAGAWHNSWCIHGDMHGKEEVHLAWSGGSIWRENVVPAPRRR